MRVLHPEAVTGQTDTERQQDNDASDSQSLPWYEELAYSFEQVDRQDASAGDPGGNPHGSSRNPRPTPQTRQERNK